MDGCRFSNHLQLHLSNNPTHSVSPLVFSGGRLYFSFVSDPQSLSFLVIGYGNTLRSDDGVGPKVAEAVRALNLAGVCVIACHQLTPELAEPISQSRVAVFVDAAADASTQVQIRKLEPSESPQIMTHAADPRTMLVLACDLFDHAPEAWWLTIPVENLGFGEGLSARAEAGLKAAIAHIQELYRRFHMS
jgi:hydrogenase maturation protease